MRRALVGSTVFRVMLQCLAILAVVVGAVWAMYVLPERRERMRAESWAKERSLAEVTIAEFCERTGATSQWEAEVRTDFGFLESPTFTVDLERAWITARPVLFLGEVLDVSLAAESAGLLVVEHADSDTLTSGGALRLKVRCPRKGINAVLNKLSRGSARDGVAIAASVVSVERAEDADGLSIFTALGEANEIVYVPDLGSVTGTGRRMSAPNTGAFTIEALDVLLKRLEDELAAEE